MRKIADNSCGYLKVGDDKYTYYISDNIVTLLPAQSDKRRYMSLLIEYAIVI